MKKYFGFFLQGLLVLSPLGVTIYIFYRILSFIGHSLQQFNFLFNPFVDPILVLILAFLVITAVGYFGSNVLFRVGFSAFETALERAPVIKIFYSTIKDFFSAFVGSKRKFNKPVLVTINKENGIQQIGFITQSDLKELGIGEHTVAVYMPHSYAISGVTLLVPAASVQPLSIPASDAMKFIVSGGVSDLD
ncbi:MAG TPA: DUF502 domain-containing protein [Bacteroidia bacterium]|nr:DUF502 domain-containing protein [Bacteroidia bacterium]